MAARFGVLVDNHVRESIVAALRRAGWDVVRAVDVFGERNDDEELLKWATANDRVFATCDSPSHEIAHRWLREKRPFRMVYWWLGWHREMTDGDMVRAFEAIAAKEEPFHYAIEYIKPQR